MQNHESALYDRLWESAQGKLETDPYLNDLPHDERNGLSLIVRIPAALHPAIMTMVEEVRPHAPDQHFYRPDELHVTVLTLIPVRQKINFTPEIIAPYQSLVAEVCQQQRPFPLRLEGITASPSTAMLQGFAGAELNQLREKLREKLQQAGLGEHLDTRYKITAAHVTFLRYRRQPSPTLAPTLAHLRGENRFFGAATITTLELTLNDYFMLREKTRTLELFHLKGV